MSNLTEDMTRLRNQIKVMRIMRRDNIHDIMRNSRGRKAFIKKMRLTFLKAHSTMAGKTKEYRATFVSTLKADITRLRIENQSDLAGAQRAWFELSNQKK